MNRIGLLIYWLGCACLGYLFFHLNDWQQFYDSFSLIATLLPAVLAAALREKESLAAKVSRCIRVCWLSAVLTCVYGVILTLSQVPPAAPFSVLAGFSVALLPLFYVLVAHLLLAPLCPQAAYGPKDTYAADTCSE